MTTRDTPHALFQWEREPWKDHAACRGMDTRMWFPERGQSAAPAIAICNTCPVIDDCHASALRTHEHHGVWGGKPERQRRAIRETLWRQRHTTRTHGLAATYETGCRCDACRAANTRRRRRGMNGAAK